MAANSYCESCGRKGRTSDGLCPECYDAVVRERWEDVSDFEAAEYE